MIFFLNRCLSCLFYLVLGSNNFLWAEYRAFKLQLELENGKTNEILTTLSAQEYQMSQSSYNIKKVTQLDSWMCYLDTSYESICEKGDVWNFVKKKKPDVNKAAGGATAPKEN